jgi:hypothetical protein
VSQFCLPTLREASNSLGQHLVAMILILDAQFPALLFLQAAEQINTLHSDVAWFYRLM